MLIRLLKFRIGKQENVGTRVDENKGPENNCTKSSENKFNRYLTGPENIGQKLRIHN